MKIVSFKICPFVQRALAIVELKDIEYEVEYISLRDKPKWFLEQSPHGQVPILIDKKGTLFESGPISEYLEENYKTNPLHPEDPFTKALHRAWIELAAKNYLVQCSTQRSPTIEVLQEKKEQLNKAFSKIEEVLSTGPYFSGDSINMVDAGWYVLLHRTHLINKLTGYDFLDDFRKTKRWREALLEVSALRKSVSDDFETEFINFYLSGKTYLGRLMRSRSGCCGDDEECDCTPEEVARCCA